jgi:hypothetical protein
MWFVDAAEDASYDITIGDVADLKFYQINKTANGDKFMWKDKEYRHFAYIQ